MAPSSTHPTTRELIVRAATECFAANGIRGTSMDDVAEAAGVHRATLYRLYAGGRDELVAEAFLARAIEVLANELPSTEESRPATEVLVEVFTSFVMICRADPVICEGICSDGARYFLTVERLRQFNTLTNQWAARLRANAAAEGLDFQEDNLTVIDFLARTLISLVRDPGILTGEAEVRRFYADFVVPGIVRPLGR